jgi:hypothetical protein
MLTNLAPAAAIIAALPAVARAADAPPCRWTAPLFARVLDGARLPDLHAKAEFAPGTAPAVAPTPAPYLWNPVFPIDRGGRVHRRSDGAVSSILTVSGGGCTETQVALLIYGDGFLPRRGIALEYGPTRTVDDLNPGSSSWTTVAAHGELEAPFRLRSVWLSADFRSIGYEHGSSPAYPVAFGVRDDAFEVRSGVALVHEGPVLELAYLNVATNAPRPDVGGLGIALEVPPTLDQTLGAYGAFSYYPVLTGGGLSYSAYRYRLGGTLSLAPTFGRPYFFEIAVVGDHRFARARSAGKASFDGVLLGAGYRFGALL